MKGEKKKVAVFFGGRSCEHDVSIITGVLTLNCMDRERYEPVPVYITAEGMFSGEGMYDIAGFEGDTGAYEVLFKAGDRNIYRLKGGKMRPMGEIYCAVNCCHGLNGEDGCLAGLMRLAGIPFASPDMLSSSVCIDKAAAKNYLLGLGVKVLPCRVVTGKAFFENRELALSLTEEKIGYPCIVKPARLGSSIGIRIASERRELVEAIEGALRYDSKLIVEKALEGACDINCAAYVSAGKIVVSECENPKPSGSLYTFEDKYISGLKRTLSRDFPAKLPSGISEKIKEITALVYRKMFITGVIRIDYLVRGEEVYLNEVNTVPGSLALYLFKNSTGEYGEVISSLIEEGVRAHREYESLCFEYGTNMLSSVPAKMK